MGRSKSRRDRGSEGEGGLIAIPQDSTVDGGAVEANTVDGGD